MRPSSDQSSEDLPVVSPRIGTVPEYRGLSCPALNPPGMIDSVVNPPQMIVYFLVIVYICLVRTITLTN